VLSTTAADVNGTITSDSLVVDGGTIKLDGNYPTGTGNVALGDTALDSVESGGNYNTAIGGLAGTAITTGDENTFVGYATGDSITTASANTGVGYNALSANTSGTQNSAFGNRSGDAITTGDGNTSVGYFSLSSTTTANNNTAVGVDSLGLNSTGANNTAVGGDALRSNTTAPENVAIGYQAALDNTTGRELVAVGERALTNNTTASYNTAIGRASMLTNTTGANNTALGWKSLYSNTTANHNTAVGYEALHDNTTGAAGTALGAYALANSTTGNDNVATGYQALFTNTTGAFNTAHGSQALRGNTTSSNNVAVGYQSLYSMSSSGDANKSTAVGYQAGYSSTHNLDAFGAQALYSNTTGILSVAIGRQALYSNTTASYNTAIGYKAGYTATVNGVNTFIGGTAGEFTTGGGNTFLGYASGQLVTTGTQNTILGRYNGNQGGLDIRTSSGNIVLSDGNGNPRMRTDSSGNTAFGSQFTNIGAISTSQAGITLGSSGYGMFQRVNSTVGYFNRQSTDGIIISFYGQGTQEGSISVSGTTVSYNGGHLARWSQLPDNTRDTSIVKGTVLTNLDQMAVWTHAAKEIGDDILDADGNVIGQETEPKAAYTEDNEQLNCMSVSSVEGDPNVAGVFVNWDDGDDIFTNDMNIAMTGDMVIRIAQSTTVARGDLLMSAGDGTAKPQGDDIVRSKTIAKVTSVTVSHTYDDGSYLVPCVLMAC
jgi:hypothetical protein